LCLPLFHVVLASMSIESMKEILLVLTEQLKAKDKQLDEKDKHIQQLMATNGKLLGQLVALNSSSVLCPSELPKERTTSLESRRTTPQRTDATRIRRQKAEKRKADTIDKAVNQHRVENIEKAQDKAETDTVKEPPKKRKKARKKKKSAEQHEGAPSAAAPCEPAASAEPPAATPVDSESVAQTASDSNPFDELRRAHKRDIRKKRGGLLIEDMMIGTGAVARVGRLVSVKYQGYLRNGKCFDKVDLIPFAFRLGVGQVIRGWDMGIEGMKVGGKRRLVIPPALGYGRNKSAEIPPNSYLLFTVEMVNVY